MERVTLGCLVLTGLLLAGCSNKPTKEEFFARERQCLRCYCCSNAPMAEAALLDCAEYARQCQQAGVNGILYDQVFARFYGRLYLVEQHLGRSRWAERYLEEYARYHANAGTLARTAGRAHGEMETLIAHKFDEGLRVSWKGQ